MASLVLRFRRLPFSSPLIVSQCLSLCLLPSSIRFNSRIPAPSRFFSASSEAEMEEAGRASANEYLNRVLQDKITRWPVTVSIPKDFPFEIGPGDDEDDHNVITLKRIFFGEKIKVTVELENLDLEYEDGEENVDDNEDVEDEDIDPNSNLYVEIDKGNGKCLKFECSSYLKKFTVHHIYLQSYQVSDKNGADAKKKINSRASDYAGLNDLDDEFWGAVKECLKARGIDGSLAKFAEQYVLSQNLKHLDWLKKFKNFTTV